MQTIYYSDIFARLFPLAIFPLEMDDLLFRIIWSTELYKQLKFIFYLAT